MKYRAIPNTDLDVSVFCLGCWPFGGKYWGDDWSDADSATAVEAALDAGVNFFDTAPLYGDGHADTVLAAALGTRRHDVVIATKVGVRMDPKSGHALSDLTPTHVIADCEASLARLGLETIPLLQVHWPCNLDTPLDETLGALESLRTAGKVRHYGLCNYDAAALRRARSIAPVATLQTPYSMVRREFERELAGACLATGDTPALGVLAYETLCRGLLSGKFGVRPPAFAESDMRSHDDRFRGRAFAQIHQLNRAIAVIAQRVGVPHAAVPVAWAMTRPGITSAIVGAKRAAQVVETCRAVELLDRAKIWDALAPYVDAVRP